ncbi:unnamed protein product [Rotaria sp. Silwood1]|nr:unnamed protein product [Rotaria sp. Silwood1]
MTNTMENFCHLSKFWSLENECDDDDEEDLQNVCIPSVSLKRDVAAVRKTYKQQEAIERATQAAACTTVEKIDDDEEDPLDKFMESITKEVKDFRENNNKGSVIQIVKKTIKNEVRTIFI